MTDKIDKPYKKYINYKDKQGSNRSFKTIGLGNILQPVFKKTFGKRGFADSRIITNWRLIVGNKFANVSAPEKISYKRGFRTGGVLHINILGAFATEITYQTGIIVEKVNSYLGYGAVTSIKLNHNFTPSVDIVKTTKKSIPNTDFERLNDMLNNIDDKDIKMRLKNIGKHIIVKD